MRRRTLALVVPVIGLMFCSLLLVLIWALPARWLAVGNDPLTHAAAIVMLNGDVERLGEVLRLYEDGWAPEIWLTQDPKSSSDDVPPPIRDPGTRANCMTLFAHGVAADVTLVLLASGTKAELQQTAREVRQRQGAVVILVTSDFHTRRARVLWDAHAGSRPRAIIHAAPGSAAPSESFIFGEKLRLIVTLFRLEGLTPTAGRIWPDVPPATRCNPAPPTDFGDRGSF